MAAGDKQATWKLDIDADNRKAKQAAEDLKKYKEAVTASKNAIDEYRIALRSLVGADEATKKARDDIKKRITDEQNAINRANIGMRNAQKGIEAFGKAGQGAKGDTEALGKAIAAVGGPVASARDKFEELKTVVGSGLGIAGTLVIVAAAAAAFVILSGAVIGGTLALARFTVENANALRAQQLTREAVTLGADDAARYGRQIDALSAKLPTSREKLNELAVSVRKAFDGTRISGQGIVDATEAIAAASSAAGDDVGRTLQGILDRSKRFGRVGINPFELQGTGAPSFDAIAGALAKRMKVGVDQATAALRTGRVPIDDAAAAIKDAVNARFGEVNAKKLLDLNVLSAKFRENLEGLARGANIEPILAGLKQVVDLFSQSTVTGKALQDTITTFSTVLNAVFSSSLPSGISLIKQAVILALRMSNALLEIAIRTVLWSKTTSGIIEMKAALYTVLAVVGLLSAAFVTVGAVIAASFAVALAPIYLLIKAVLGFQEAFAQLKAVNWAELGSNIVDGIKNGLLAAKDRLVAAVTGVASSVKETFKNALGIHSPSAVFAAYGENTVEGYSRGVKGSSAVAHEAVAQIVHEPSPAGGGSSASSGGGGGGRAEYHFHFAPGTNPEQAMAAMGNTSILDAITRAIEVANRAAGIPTQTPVTP